MSKTVTIVFSCQHCGQEIEVESSAAGMRCECPSCEGAITIPLRSPSKNEALKSPLDKFYHAMEDFQKEVTEFKGSGLDLNSAMLSGTKEHMQGTLKELIELSKQVCEEVDAKGFKLDITVGWPPTVSISFDFAHASPAEG